MCVGRRTTDWCQRFNALQNTATESWSLYSFQLKVRVIMMLTLSSLVEPEVDIKTASGTTHDDVIKWKHFPRYWPFVRGIHRWPVTHKGQWRFDVFFDMRLNKRLGKQSRRRWFGTPSHSLWRRCNAMTTKVNHDSTRLSVVMCLSSVSSCFLDIYRSTSVKELSST